VTRLNKTVHQMASEAQSKLPAPDWVKPKKKKRLSVNKLVMDWLRAKGWEVGLVEQRIPHTFITRDLFGFVDMIAVGHGQIIGLQVTSNNGGHVANRITKAKEQDAFETFVKAAPLYFVGVNIRDDKTVRYRIVRVTEESQTELDEIPTANSIRFESCRGCGKVECVC